MRCDCCDKRLNDYESTLKSAEFGVYMNTCVKCLKGLGITVSGREDLRPINNELDGEDEDMYDWETENYYKEIGLSLDDTENE